MGVRRIMRSKGRMMMILKKMINKIKSKKQELKI